MFFLQGLRGVCGKASTIGESEAVTHLVDDLRVGRPFDRKSARKRPDADRQSLCNIRCGRATTWQLSLNLVLHSTPKRAHGCLARRSRLVSEGPERF